MSGSNVRTRPYKVRRSWEDTKTQMASYTYLDKAKVLADVCMYDGYKVFLDGKIVYDPLESVAEADSVMNSEEDTIETYNAVTAKLNNNSKKEMQYINVTDNDVWSSNIFIRAIRRIRQFFGI